jgi:hypothetical protein
VNLPRLRCDAMPEIVRSNVRNRFAHHPIPSTDSNASRLLSLRNRGAMQNRRRSHRRLGESPTWHVAFTSSAPRSTYPNAVRFTLVVGAGHDRRLDVMPMRHREEKGRVRPPTRCGPRLRFGKRMRDGSDGSLWLLRHRPRDPQAHDNTQDAAGHRAPGRVTRRRCLDRPHGEPRGADRGCLCDGKPGDSFRFVTAIAAVSSDRVAYAPSLHWLPGMTASWLNTLIR